MTFSQDPTAVLDYEIDWSAWLPPTDTITAAVWSVQNLTPPMQLSLVTANTGGTLAAGTFYWVVTAVDAAGETTRSNEVSATFAQSNGVAGLSWQMVPNATGYKVYRGTTSGGENLLLATISSGSVTSWSDNGGAAGVAGSPPAVNTAALGVTIASTPPPALTATTTTAFVQGGTVGVVYTVGCHVTTEAGRQAERYLTISIAEQYLS